MTLQKPQVIQKNLEQLKAEVKKHHFLIYSIFFPLNFTYCKVDNHAFNYQTAIVKLAEKLFYGVGRKTVTIHPKYFISIGLLNNGFLFLTEQKKNNNNMGTQKQPK